MTALYFSALSLLYMRQWFPALLPPVLQGSQPPAFWRNRAPIPLPVPIHVSAENYVQQPFPQSLPFPQE